jgi:hypothetical protein
MNTQPEALRLVEWLDLGSDPYDKAAATELRRLHEVNQELVEALEYHQEQTRPIQKTIDVLAKARGEA